MEAELLRVELPRLSVNPHEPAARFFDRCGQIAQARGWQVDRRRDYAQTSSDQLNLHLDPTGSADPMIRMVCWPPCVDTRLGADPPHLSCDILPRLSRPGGNLPQLAIPDFRIVQASPRVKYPCSPLGSVGSGPSSRVKVVFSPFRFTLQRTTTPPWLVHW